MRLLLISGLFGSCLCIVLELFGCCLDVVLMLFGGCLDVVLEVAGGVSGACGALKLTSSPIERSCFAQGWDKLVH